MVPDGSDPRSHRWRQFRPGLVITFSFLSAPMHVVTNPTSRPALATFVTQVFTAIRVHLLYKFGFSSHLSQPTPISIRPLPLSLFYPIVSGQADVVPPITVSVIDPLALLMRFSSLGCANGCRNLQPLSTWCCVNTTYVTSYPIHCCHSPQLHPPFSLTGRGRHPSSWRARLGRFVAHLNPQTSHRMTTASDHFPTHLCPKLHPSHLVGMQFQFRVAPAETFLSIAMTHCV